MNASEIAEEIKKLFRTQNLKTNEVIYEMSLQFNLINNLNPKEKALVYNEPIKQY